MQILKDYVTESGLVKMGPWDVRPSLVTGVETVGADNGIQVLAECINQIRRSGIEYDREWLSKIAYTALCSIDEAPGLFNRRPGENQFSEAHDNPAAVAYICAFFNWPLRCNQMIRYWWTHFGVMKNTEHGKINWLRPKELVKFYRQPGEVALYYMAADRNPPWFMFLWFCGGLMVTALNKKAKPFQVKIAFLRLETKGPKGLLKRFINNKVKAFCMDRFDIGWAYRNYYFKDHPINVLQRMIEGKQ
jgi:hypothetical protein